MPVIMLLTIETGHDILHTHPVAVNAKNEARVMKMQRSRGPHRLRYNAVPAVLYNEIAAAKSTANVLIARFC